MKSPPPVWDASQVHNPPKSKTGLWIALGVCGFGGCFCCVIGAAILFPVFAQARVAAKQTLCLSNVKQLGLGMLMYANDNNDSFPDASKWEDKLDKGNYYLKSAGEVGRKVYTCPTLKSGYGYAMSDKLSKFNSMEVKNPSTEPLIFESDQLDWNSHGNASHPASPPRHGKRNNFAYADGHAKSEEN